MTPSLLLDTGADADEPPSSPSSSPLSSSSSSQFDDAANTFDSDFLPVNKSLKSEAYDCNETDIAIPRDSMCIGSRQIGYVISISASSPHKIGNVKNKSSEEGTITNTEKINLTKKQHQPLTRTPAVDDAASTVTLFSSPCTCEPRLEHITFIGNQ